jgi:hypothetical protein
MRVTLSPPAAPWHPSFYPGQQIVIIAGTFAGMEAEVIGQPSLSGLVPVSLRIFGRPVPVEVEPWRLALGRPLSEAEWLTCPEAPALAWDLHARRRWPTQRQMRLFACACLAWLAHALADECYRRALETAERYADGRAGPKDLEMARSQVARALGPSLAPQLRGGPAAETVLAVTLPNATEAWRTVLEAPGLNAEERAWQADLLREVIGNPFRHVSSPAAWLRWDGGCVTKIARSIYDGRRFEELPVLADALEEAGCEEDAILSHCRRPAEHALGCWVLDRLLGHS